MGISALKLCLPSPSEPVEDHSFVHDIHGVLCLNARGFNALPPIIFFSQPKDTYI